MHGKALRDKLVGSDDERAVSPVIGVILMVAITVILAAVIATLVMDFGDSVNQDAQAGVTIDQETDGDIRVNWASEGNAERIYIQASGSCEFDSSTNNPITSVGTSAYNTSGTCDGETVTAIADNGQSNTTVQEFEVPS